MSITKVLPIQGMHCQSCVGKITAEFKALDAQAIVTLDPPQIVLTEDLTEVEIGHALRRAGDYSIARSVSQNSFTLATFYPLVLIFIFLLGVCYLAQFDAPAWDEAKAMRNFMGGFFLIFSFFKFLNLRQFAAAYASYDLLASRWLPYGFIYPFMELTLGIAFITNSAPLMTNSATVILMTFSTLGVVKVLKEKRNIPCACLGSVIQLPMTWITFTENALMVFLALRSLGS